MEFYCCFSERGLIVKRRFCTSVKVAVEVSCNPGISFSTSLQQRALIAISVEHVLPSEFFLSCCALELIKWEDSEVAGSSK